MMAILQHICSTSSVCNGSVEIVGPVLTQMGDQVFLLRFYRVNGYGRLIKDNKFGLCVMPQAIFRRRRRPPG